MNTKPIDFTGPAPTIQQQRILTLYLCGPIKDRSDADCRTWRNWIKQHWPGRCLDPMDRDYRRLVAWSESDAEKLVHQDLADIDQSDGLVVYYDRPSVGTSMEIFYAAHVRRKPVFLINASETGLPSGYLSPWLLYHVSGISESLTLQTLADIEHEIRRRIA